MHHRRQYSQSTYQYRPLDTATNDIRLAKLVLKLSPVPRKVEVGVEIILETFAGNKCPKYDVLSYTWGSELSWDQIVVNDNNLAVSRNLFMIMGHLHNIRFDRWIWIDAISINQRDNREKTLQVQRMRSIYQQAKRVLAWTGSYERTLTVL